MTEAKTLPVVRGGSSLATIGPGARSLIGRMVSDALGVPYQGAIAPVTLHRIGDYEFCDADFRQILLWAEQVGESPGYVVECFSRAENPRSDCSFSFEVVDGRILKLVWDLAAMPIDLFECREPLRMTHLMFEGSSDGQRLTELRLTGCKGLVYLDCSSNFLTELNLSAVSGLRELRCYHNQLTALDLSAVPELRELWCHYNQLTELDLSPVTDLRILSCGDNPLTELDLSAVPELETLSCSENQLTELDLSAVPELETLSCVGKRWNGFCGACLPEFRMSTRGGRSQRKSYWTTRKHCN